MKLPVVSILILSFLSACQTSSEVKTSSDPNPTDEVTYDSLLAEKVGADQYGMRPYVLAYLKRGPNRDRSPEEAAELQRAHLDNIKRLAEEGKLVLAGPFMDDGDVRGIYIFAVDSMEEAEELTKSDPAIAAGSLVMELRPWYGSAALMEMGTLSKKITREGI